MGIFSPSYPRTELTGFDKRRKLRWLAWLPPPPLRVLLSDAHSYFVSLSRPGRRVLSNSIGLLGYSILWLLTPSTSTDIVIEGSRSMLQGDQWPCILHKTRLLSSPAALHQPLSVHRYSVVVSGCLASPPMDHSKTLKVLIVGEAQCSQLLTHQVGCHHFTEATTHTRAVFSQR